MESFTMRSTLGFCVLLVPTSLFAQQPGTQPPAVSTSVPNIHASGAATAPNSSSVTPVGTSAATTYSENSVATQARCEHDGSFEME